MKDNTILKNSIALSLVLLACSIFYIGFQINSFVSFLPTLTNILAEKKLDGITPVLTEVAEIRKEIPLILNEVKEVRKIIPKTLKTIDSASQSISSAAEQIETLEPHIKPILKEVKSTREALPEILDKTEVVLKDANKAAEKAGSSLITGVIKSPFKLVGDIGSSFGNIVSPSKRKWNSEDDKLATAAGQKVLQSDEEGFKEEWKNKKSKRYGSVELIKIHEEGCKTIKVEIFSSKSRSLFDEKLKLCPTQNGKWSQAK